jgi:VWFA-related protein
MLLWAATLLAQQPDPEEIRILRLPYDPGSRHTFRVETSLVEAGVLVRNFRGDIVTGLNKDDFEIYDAGKRKNVEYFATVPGAPSEDDGLPRRFVAFVFDDTSRRFVGDLIYAKESAKRFVSKGLAPGDVVSVFTFSGRQVLPFTRDPQSIIAALDRVTLRSFAHIVPAQIIADVVSYMSRMPGQRIMVLCSSMFYAQRFDQESIISRAIRGGVIINGIAAQGVSAMSIRGDPSLEAMPYVAESTGGVYFTRNNDLVLGFKTTAAPPELGYILGFYPDDVRDGHYHRLTVKVRSTAARSVQARPGYFAPKKETERPIDRAFASAEDLNQIPGVRIVTLPGTDSIQDEIASIKVVAHFDAKDALFRRQYDRHVQNFRFVAALLDQQGSPVTGAEGIIELALKEDTYTSLKDGLNVILELQAPIGSYYLRAVIQEGLQGKMTAVRLPIRLPSNDGLDLLSVSTGVSQQIQEFAADRRRFRCFAAVVSSR